MSDYMSAERFVSKIECEGGVIEALEYGLRHTDLDPDDEGSADLRAKWFELWQAWLTLSPLVDEIDQLMYEIGATR
jgi:hypothetical protein